MKKRFTSLIILLILALSISCSAKAEKISLQATDSSNSFGRMLMEESKMVYAEEEMSTDGTSGVQIEIPQGRKVILNAIVQMETLEFDKTIQGLTKAIQKNGGYISDSSQSGSGDGKSRRDYHIAARIPTDNYNTFLNDTAEVGNIIFKQESSTDVTSQYIDVEARLLTLKQQEVRLLALLEKSGDLESLILIEERLSEVRYEIERFEVEKRTFVDLISYSTVNISVSEVKTITETDETFFPQLKDSISASWNNFVSGLKNCLFRFIHVLPALFIWIAIIFGTVFFAKKMIKKRKKRLVNGESNAVSTEKDALSKQTKKDDVE